MEHVFDIISHAYTEHSLVSVLLGFAAVGVGFAFDEKVFRGKRNVNFFVVFVGWALAVPIVGFAASILETLWSYIEKTVPLLAAVVGSFYRIYQGHPIIVLVILGVGLVGYFVWAWKWPKVMPNRAVRMLAVIAGAILVAHIAGPLADLFPPAASAVAVQKPSAPAAPKATQPGSESRTIADSSIDSASKPTKVQK